MAVKKTICLNADIGELPGANGRALDRAILDVVSRCSIASGGHAGDQASMVATVKAADARGVLIGAHPSYPDREGFGRKPMAMSRDDLAASLSQQVRALAAITRERGASLSHLKPHGALYNTAAQDESIARTIVDVTTQSRIALLIGPPNSCLEVAAAEAGLDFLAEGFADRAYEMSGALTPRSLTGAVLETDAERIRQAVQIAADHQVSTRTGETIDLPVRTICVHGDTPGALASALAIRDALNAAGIEINAVTP
jgi:5-oxoprolinase (ATP-hydrolysing) subunit A